MKIKATVQQTLLLAFLVVGVVSVTAIASEYSGFVEIRCGSQECRLVIDGRSDSD